MTSAGRIERELYELADDLQEKAERMKDANAGWAGEEKYYHQRKGQARGLEQASDEIRSIIEREDE